MFRLEAKIHTAHINMRIFTTNLELKLLLFHFEYLGKLIIIKN